MPPQERQRVPHEENTLARLLSQQTNTDGQNLAITEEKKPVLQKADIAETLRAIDLEQYASVPEFSTLIDTVEKYQKVLTIQRIEDELILGLLLGLIGLVIFMLIPVSEYKLRVFDPALILLFIIELVGIYGVNLEKIYLGERFEASISTNRTEKLKNYREELEVKIEATARSLGWHEYPKYSTQNLSRLVRKNTKPLRRTLKKLREKGKQTTETYHQLDLVDQREQRINDYLAALKTLGDKTSNKDIENIS